MELGLTVETEISGRAPADLYYMGSGGLCWSSVLNSALLPQRLRPDTQPEHQDSVSHTAASFVGSPAEAVVAVAHCEDKDTGSRNSGKYSLV